MSHLMRVQIKPFARESLIEVLKSLSIKNVSVKDTMLYISESEHGCEPRIEADFIVGDFQAGEIAATLREKFKRHDLRLLSFQVNIL
jgi:hypothetical protein